jgi:aminomethyltransferase
MTTNHVERLQPGQGCYVFFLNAQGRILADANLFCLPEVLLLDTEPEIAEKLYQHIDRYIIADDVELENASDRITAVGVEGPRAGEILRSVGAPEPGDDLAVVQWDERYVARVSAAAASGFRIFTPAGAADELVEMLRSAGAAEASADDIRSVRIENAKPRYGEDITEDYIPHETQAMRALHFDKGCYLGQEIVERVRSRGHVNKLLLQLRIDGDSAPAAGTKLMAGEKEAGVITSSAVSPALGGVVALGYARAIHAKLGEALTVGPANAEVTALGVN